MYIGQSVVCCPLTVEGDISSEEQKVKIKPQTGRIVYIHPRRRYVNVEFSAGLKESFFPDEILNWGKGARS